MLPTDFSDLEQFAPWILPTEVARMQKRRESTLDDLQHLYGAVLPRLEAILSHLERFPLDALPEAEKNLLRLSTALAEVAPFVEQYKRTILPEIFDESRFLPLHDKTAA